MDDRPRQQILTLIAIALTFASGATDVASYTRLGNVFTSVMTGNIVLLGLAIARGSLTLASHSTVSIAGYIAGVAGGTWIARGATRKDRSGEGGSGEAGAGEAGAGEAGAGEAPASGLPSHVVWALAAEFILLAGLAVGWELSGARPTGWLQFCLLPVAAAAMGVQSATVKYMGLTEVSTTYLTGTLTGLVSSLVSSLVSPGQGTQYGLRRFGVLIGLAMGAGLSGLLVATAAAGVPALPLTALVTAIVLASALRRRSSRLLLLRRSLFQRSVSSRPLSRRPGDGGPGDGRPGDGSDRKSRGLWPAADPAVRRPRFAHRGRSGDRFRPAGAQAGQGPDRDA
jgi:uncharacterized membrane protein YoaK (UPF0700 family)